MASRRGAWASMAVVAAIAAATGCGSGASPATTGAGSVETASDDTGDLSRDDPSGADGAADTAAPEAEAAQDTDAADSSADAGAETSADVSADADTTPPATCKTSADCPQPATGCTGNVCHAGTCTPQTLADGSPCNDGQPCTAKAQCQAGACTAVASVACDDGDDCTTDACDTLTGICSATQGTPGAACDDGQPCTAGTTCDGAGACAGGVNTCGCKTIQDCAAYDDGDPCNGALYCNTKLPTPACEVLPGSIVVCDSSGDGACMQTVCAAAAGGQCVTVPMAAGAPCDDGSACSKGDQCANGLCQGLVNTCQCQISADCVPYEDGNACNGTLYCDSSALPYQCKLNPASIVVCPKPAGACQVSACDAKSGTCKANPAIDGSPCEDGNAKTVGDSCQAGACKPGQSVAQCEADADCAKWEDGDYCNGVKFCNKAEGLCQDNPATVVGCPIADDTACSKIACEPKSGLCKPVAALNGTPCSDGDSCTVGDACLGGACQPSANTCECKQDGDCKGKEDGNQCNGTLFCDQTQAKCVLNPATVIACPSVDDTACAQNLCQPKAGTCAVTPLADGAACDDDNPCSEGEACQGGSCTGTKVCACALDADCASQDDGDLCNGTLYCHKKSATCEVNPATIKACPTVDDTACAHNQCQPKTGTCALSPTSFGIACDADGNPCTQNDYCSAGACKPGKVTCECNSDAECAGVKGDNKCIVDMFCDKTVHACKPTKLVTCDGSKDSACAATACDPSDGQCKTSLAAEGTLCGESAICAGAQVCDSKGQCVPGAASDCDDADACTKDTCDPKKGCIFVVLDAGACDDGNVCSDKDACIKGKCVGTTKDCSDASPCTNDACDPKAGCTHLPAAATTCNDDDTCTVGDFCLAGLCLPGSKVLACDDGNPCSKDSCDAIQGCIAKAVDGGKCDDGDSCTKLDACVGGGCKGVQLSCDDGSGCTVDSCDMDEGCQHKAQVGKGCDDGSACTVGDACVASGLCASGQPKACDDANPCTTDLCDPLQGCVIKDVVTSKCDDANACTVNEKCDKGQCSGSPRDCDDGLACSKDSCDKDAGCLHAVNAGDKCDDGNACTQGDKCSAVGSCAPGKTLACNDGKACTADSCDADKGCVYEDLSDIVCSDGDACTANDACAAGACKGSPVTCDDSNACTTDSCDSKTGCKASVKAGAGCNDGNACTGSDSCDEAGTCSGVKVVCDDKGVCTLDTCQPDTGCAFLKLTGTACDDGKLCTVADACGDGVCAGQPKNCDDGEVCSADTCDPAKGCLHANLPNQGCTDGNACTDPDACIGGTCGGPTLSCDDGNACTQDACNALKGCAYTSTAQWSDCSDGDACTTDWCDGKGTCASKPTLWKYELPAGYVAHDMLAIAGEGLWVVGSTSGLSYDSFAIKIPFKGAPLNPAITGSVAAWQKVVAAEDAKGVVRPVVVGLYRNASVPQNGEQGFGPYLRRLDASGNVISQYSFRTIAFAPSEAKVEAAARGKQVAVAFATHGFAFDVDASWHTGATKTTDVFKAAPNAVTIATIDGGLAAAPKLWRWTSEGSNPIPKEEFVAVHGVAPLGSDGTRVAVLASVTTPSRTRTHLLIAGASGGLTVANTWTSGPSVDEAWVAAASNRLFAHVEGTTDVLDIVRPRGHIVERRHVLAGKEIADYIGTYFGVVAAFQPYAHIARRGDRWVGVTAGAPVAFRVFGKQLGKTKHETPLASVPTLLATGPERAIYMLDRDNTPSATIDTVRRLDPWGAETCSACLTAHALGCLGGDACALDTCSWITGKCAAQDTTACADGLSCVTRSCSNKACVNSTAADGSTCKYTQSQRYGNTGLDGTCAAGVCTATPPQPIACSAHPATHSACVDGVAADDYGCPANVIMGLGTSCGASAVCAHTGQCFGEQAQTIVADPAVLAALKPTSANVVSWPFLATKPLTPFTWMRLEVGVKLKWVGGSPTPVSKAFAALVVRAKDGPSFQIAADPVACLADDIAHSCFPAYADHATFTFPLTNGAGPSWNAFVTELAAAAGPYSVEVQAKGSQIMLTSVKVTFGTYSK